MIERLLKSLSLLFIVTLLPSCSDDVPYNDCAELYDIVTYKETSSNGAVFTFQRMDDSPLVTLTAEGRRLNDIVPGHRLLIGYYPENGEPYTSGNITLTEVVMINYDKLQSGDKEEIDGWDADAIYLNSIWRTGNYLNIYFRADQSSENRRFMLMVDEATSEDEFPQLYLVHDMLGQPDNFTRRAYASFDISSIWDKDTCRGVTIHVNDSNLETDSYIFTK